MSSRPPQYLLDELDRLLRLEADSHGELVSYIKAAGLDVPLEILELLEIDAAAAQLERVKEVRDGTTTRPTHSPRGQQTVTKRASTRRAFEPSLPVIVDASEKKRKTSRREVVKETDARGRKRARAETSDGDDGIEDVLKDSGVSAMIGVTVAGAMLAARGTKVSEESENDGGELSCSPCSVSATGEASALGPTIKVYCSRKCHRCGPPRKEGCSSCGLLCHTTCESELCDVEACEICLSYRLPVCRGAALCEQLQQQVGCHDCGRVGCSSGFDGCHGKCVAGRHVCAKAKASDPQCESCGKVCHRDNTDPRCDFYGFDRGDLPWEATPLQLLDSQAGGNVSHCRGFSWRFLFGSRGALEVDGLTYRRTAASSDGNNCLIDSLRQCLKIAACDCSLVRQELLRQFGNASGPANVTARSHLDAESHWKAILVSLLRMHAGEIATSRDPEDYSVVVLACHREGQGDLLGDSQAPHRLVVMNEDNLHFEPCMRI